MGSNWLAGLSSVWKSGSYGAAEWQSTVEQSAAEGCCCGVCSGRDLLRCQGCCCCTSRCERVTAQLLCSFGCVTGAVGLIVIQSGDEWPFIMPDSDSSSMLLLPCVMIQADDGMQLLNSMSTASTLQATCMSYSPVAEPCTRLFSRPWLKRIC